MQDRKRQDMKDYRKMISFTFYFKTGQEVTYIIHILPLAILHILFF